MDNQNPTDSTGMASDAKTPRPERVLIATIIASAIVLFCESVLISLFAHAWENDDYLGIGLMTMAVNPVANGFLVIFGWVTSSLLKPISHQASTMMFVSVAVVIPLVCVVLNPLLGPIASGIPMASEWWKLFQ